MSVRFRCSAARSLEDDCDTASIYMRKHVAIGCIMHHLANGIHPFGIASLSSGEIPLLVNKGICSQSGPSSVQWPLTSQLHLMLVLCVFHGYVVSSVCYCVTRILLLKKKHFYLTIHHHRPSCTPHQHTRHPPCVASPQPHE